MNYQIQDIEIKGITFYSMEVYLPKTTLLIVGNDNGYFMCGALDVDLFDSKEHLRARKVVCGRALGVKTIDELLNAKLDKITKEAEAKGIFKGMLVKDALLLIA